MDHSCVPAIKSVHLGNEPDCHSLTSTPMSRWSTWLTTACVIAAAALPTSAAANIAIAGPAPANHVAAVAVGLGATTGNATLAPDPVVYLPGATQALKNELAAAYANWTFNYVPGLNGTLTIDNYKATTGGGLNGGGLLEATYTRANTDPAIADLFWIQLITTNRPLNNAVSPYIDPQPNDDNLPFYWTLAEDAQAANGNKTAATYHFYDNSSRTAVAPNDSISWRAELMLASWNHNVPGVVYVYDGVRWGWDLNVTTPPPVPEPGAAALLLAGLLVLALRRRH